MNFWGEIPESWGLKEDRERAVNFVRAAWSLLEEDWSDDNKVRAMLAKADIANSEEDVAFARKLRESHKDGAEIENYFPTRLTQENRKALKANDDISAPFHFNFFANGLDLVKFRLRLVRQ